MLCIRAIAISLLIAGLATIVGVVALAPDPAVAAEAKNLQILPRGTSKKEVKRIMRQMGKALGVKCKFCHTMSNMAKDTAKKETARKMMRMVRFINGTYLKGAERTVDCKTCHRGKAEPAR